MTIKESINVALEGLQARHHCEQSVGTCSCVTGRAYRKLVQLRQEIAQGRKLAKAERIERMRAIDSDHEQTTRPRLTKRGRTKLPSVASVVNYAISI